MKEIILDVRERDEFKLEHAPGAINLPLSEIKSAGPNLLKHFENCDLVLMCLSGKRAKMAQEQINNLGFQLPGLKIYEGGINAWKSAGQPTTVSAAKAIPLMRQVLIAAGSLLLVSFALGYFLNPIWFWGSAVIGSGLLFAGTTGICPMANVLARMPWNK
jgi:rhodanese-related sulfurtransferase